MRNSPLIDRLLLPPEIRGLLDTLTVDNTDIASLVFEFV